MTDFDHRLGAALDQLVPEPEHTSGDWSDAFRRAQRSARRRRAFIAVAVAATALVGLTAAAFGGGLGGFSAWLTGEPGKPASKAVQVVFRAQNRMRISPFPGPPELRRLIEVKAGGARYGLYGFRSRRIVCLRLYVDGSPRTGPSMSCLSLRELRLARGLVIPMIGDLGYPAPRRAIVTFGFAADQVRSLALSSDEGPSSPVLGGGAFLDVLLPARQWTQVREATATDRNGNRRTVPVWVGVAGEPPVVHPLRARGPSPSRVPRSRRGRIIHLVSASFSGGGSQFATIEGFASVRVARLELFLATGERRRLGDTIKTRIPLWKFPARVVAYDRRGRILDVRDFRMDQGWEGIPGPIPSHVALDVHTRAGEVVVKAGTYHHGGTCYSLDLSRTSFRFAWESRRFAHCVRGLRRNEVKLTGGFYAGTGSYTFGRTGGNVASVEFRLPGGAKRIVRPREGFLVFVSRMQPIAWIARDARGKIVSRYPPE